MTLLQTLRAARKIRLPRPDRPLVSVLIPAFRSRDHLARCLRSLAELRREAALFETVLVLNGAAPQVVELIRGGVAGATVVASEANRGIAGAFNLGAAHARGEHLLLAQDDIQPEPGWVEGLLEALERFPEAGAAGSLALDFDGRLQAAGGVLWRDGSTSPPWEGEPPAAAAFAGAEPFPVDYCGTCSLMLRREVWRAVGGADEAFFPAYYVDVDLCTAVREQGRTVLCAPRSRIRHRRGASTSASFRRFLTGENRRRLLAKWPDALGGQAERSPRLEEALAEAARRTRARAEELAARFRSGPAAQLPEPDPAPPAAEKPAVDYLRRELELRQRYGEWLEAREAASSAELAALEGHYRDLEGHARGLEANLARKDEHIAGLERELRRLRTGERP